MHLCQCIVGKKRLNQTKMLVVIFVLVQNVSLAGLVGRYRIPPCRLSALKMDAVSSLVNVLYLLLTPHFNICRLG